ncbi:MAG: hypothetical protein IJ309_07365 [Clostridia bacterium]|nr:hypothetical protein [Clostridia bacterium]
MEKKSQTAGKTRGLFGLLRESFIGRFFTSYEKDNDAFLASGERRKAKRHPSALRRKIVRAIERNPILLAIQSVFTFLFRISVRSYGAMLFVMGLIVAALYPLNGMIMYVHVSFESFVASTAVAICSIPLLFADRSLASSILASKPVSFVLFNLLGFDEEDVRVVAEQNRISFTNIAVAIGVGLAILSYFVSPIAIILAVIVIVAVYCTFRNPESGAMITIFIIPFLPLNFVKISLVISALAYFVKLFLGKRVFRFGFLDVFAVGAIVMMTICGINYFDPLSSIPTIVDNLVIFLGYFLFSNIISSKDWFRRALTAFIDSAIIVSVIGIVEAILGKLSEVIPELLVAFPYNGTISSTFETGEQLAQFLVLALPFALTYMFSDKKDMGKFGGFMLTALLVVTLCLTGSPLGILGFVVGTVLALMFYNRKVFYPTISIIIILIVLYFLLPEIAINQLEGLIGADLDVIPASFKYIWDTFLMVIKRPFGFSVGTPVNQVFTEFSGEYINCLPNQLLFEYGILSAVAFIGFSVVFARLVFSYCDNAKNKYRMINCCSGFCAVCGFMAMGLFSHVLYDSRMLLLLILCVSATLAYVRIERAEEGYDYARDDFSRATIEIEFSEDEARDSFSTRKYVHKLRKKKKIKKVEAKEFSNTEDIIRIEENDEE